VGLPWDLFLQSSLTRPRLLTLLNAVPFAYTPDPTFVLGAFFPVAVFCFGHFRQAFSISPITPMFVRRLDSSHPASCHFIPLSFSQFFCLPPPPPKTNPPPQRKKHISYGPPCVFLLIIPFGHLCGFFSLVALPPLFGVNCLANINCVSCRSGLRRDLPLSFLLPSPPVLSAPLSLGHSCGESCQLLLSVRLFG